jgi:hypothetical protein
MVMNNEFENTDISIWESIVLENEKLRQTILEQKKIEEKIEKEKKRNENYESMLNEVMYELGYIIAVRNRVDTEPKIYNWKLKQWFNFTGVKKFLPKSFVERWKIEADSNYFILSVRPDMPINSIFVNEDGGRCWNMYSGWQITREKKDFPHIKDFLYRIICNNNDNNYEYLLKWLSKIISHPEKKSTIALGLQGLAGVGKNTLFEILQMIIGISYCYSTSEKEDVIAKFNGWLKDSLLVFFDEGNLGKPEYNKLKKWISEDYIPIQYKGVDSFPEKNFTNFILATNELKFLPLDSTDRRWFVLEVNPVERGKKEYWESLRKNFIPNEISGFVNYLYELNVESLEGEEPPMTDAKAYQQNNALPLSVQWWNDFIESDNFKELLTQKENCNVIPCVNARKLYESDTLNKITDKTFIKEITFNTNIKTIKPRTNTFFVISQISYKKSVAIDAIDAENELVGKFKNENENDVLLGVEKSLQSLQSLHNDNFEDQIHNMLESPNADMTKGDYDYFDNNLNTREVI